MDNLLFSKLDGYSVMENQKKQLRDAVASAPETICNQSDEVIVNDFVQRFSLDVPKLNEEAMQTSEREIEIDVSRDPRRMFFEGHPEGFHVRGTEITVHIPFTGESVLFDVQPNMFSTTMPRGVISGRELLLSFRFANDSPPSNIKGDLESRLSQIRQYLSRLEEMANTLHNELRLIAIQAWQSRKDAFTQRRSVVAGLGLPVRQVRPVSEQTRSMRSIPAAANQVPRSREDKWDAFISHASEDKEGFVKPLAEALREAGLRVWYDEFRLTWGDSLRAKIDEGLSKSRFGIVVLSPAFFAKHWPIQELNGLAAREVDGVKVILPIWHGIGRKEVAENSPMLADRIAVSSSTGITHIVEELKKIIE